MNGAYLSGLEQMTIRPFENIELQYNQMSTISDYVHKELSIEKVTQLKNLIKLITGFQSALSIETLATVDFILKDKPNASLAEVNTAIQQWNSRKKNLFKPAHIEVAYRHLLEYRNSVDL